MFYLIARINLENLAVDHVRISQESASNCTIRVGKELYTNLLPGYEWKSRKEIICHLAAFPHIYHGLDSVLADDLRQDLMVEQGTHKNRLDAHMDLYDIHKFEEEKKRDKNPVRVALEKIREDIFERIEYYQIHSPFSSWAEAVISGHSNSIVILNRHLSSIKR